MKNIELLRELVPLRMNKLSEVFLTSAMAPTSHVKEEIAEQLSEVKASEKFLHDKVAKLEKRNRKLKKKVGKLKVQKRELKQELAKLRGQVQTPEVQTVLLTARNGSPGINLVEEPQEEEDEERLNNNNAEAVH